jgi:hypothetical protein
MREMEIPTMTRPRVPPKLSLILALISLLVASAPACGLVLERDLVGRTIFATTWFFVGMAWLGQFLLAKDSSSLDEKSQEPSDGTQTKRH